jgi:hypothetical protein
MAVAVAGSSVMGIGFETTVNTYAAPTIWIPFLSESLQYNNNIDFGREIRNSVDVNYALRGNVNVSGDITMKVREDVLVALLYSGRYTIVKSGSSPNFTYTLTPSSSLQVNTGGGDLTRTLTIQIQKNGVVYAYTGCVLSSEKYTFNNGNLEGTFSFLGSDEASQTLITSQTWPTTDPFAVGQYTIESPTGTPNNKVEQFELTVENNAQSQNRIGTVGAVYQAFGERDVTLSLTKDFESKAEYDAFKALTSNSLSLAATKGTNNSVTWTFGKLITNTYQTSLGSQGDIIKAQLEARALNSPNNPFGLVIKTQANIT